VTAEVAGAVSVVGKTADAYLDVVVAVTTWSANETNDDAAVAYLSDVQGVKLVGADGEEINMLTDDVDLGFQLTISLSGGGGGDDDSDVSHGGIQRALQCSYYDGDRGMWSSRGVFLRGIKVNKGSDGDGDGYDGLEHHEDAQPAGRLLGGDDDNDDAISVEAMCVSTHLTLFAVTDSSEAVQAVEAKVELLASRLDALDGVNLADPCVLSLSKACTPS
jgi:hypothetical protein